MTVIIDPGHGLGNRSRGVYDPGATAAGFTEAGIVMDWANELRGILMERGCKVVRTRVDATDPASVTARAGIAKQFGGEIMVSLHCNAYNGKAEGTETFYRGQSNANKAERLNLAVVNALETVNRGIKTEGQSQHARLAVMSFQPCFLIEIGFIDNALDRAKMLVPSIRKKACLALADVILS
jgi:N-acetylmuramoyl-L-alanine amidase